MPPKPKKITRKVKDDDYLADSEEDSEPEEQTKVKVEVKEEPNEEILEKEMTPKHVDDDSDDGGIISSEEEDGGESLLQDSEDENSAGQPLKIPAAVAALPGSYDDLPDRPLPNKKHKCLQSEIATVRNISGPEACSSGKPANLPIQKIKLHYVVHYLHRGTFNDIIPDLEGDEKKKVEAYECNICQKKFRNNVQKGEFSARGSYVCHLATEHGKILNAMKEDNEVDMKPVIELLKTYDKQFREFTITGTKTEHDDNLVTVRESPYWRLNCLKKDGDGNNEGEKKVEITSQSLGRPQSASAQHYKNSFEGYHSCPKCDDMKRNRDRANLRIHLFQHYLKHWEERLNLVAPAGVDTMEIKCDYSPKCEKKTTGASAEGARKSMVCHWAINHEELKDVLLQDADISKDFVERLYIKQDNNMDPKAVAIATGGVALQKQVNISNRVSSGDAISAPSVLDSNHKQNMEQNQGRGGPLITKVTLPNQPNNVDPKAVAIAAGGGVALQKQANISDTVCGEDAISVPSVPESNHKQIMEQNQGRVGPLISKVIVGESQKKETKKRQKKSLVDSSDDSTTSDDDDEALEDSSEDSSNGEQNKLKPFSGQSNPSYIRKRSRINFTLDSGNESDEWDDGKKGKKRKKGIDGNSYAKRNIKSNSTSSDGETAIVLKNRPPRKAASAASNRVKVAIKEEYISDEEEF